MIVKIADNIISPLGFGSAANYAAVSRGETRLCLHDGTFGLPEAFCGSLLDRDAISQRFAETVTQAGDYSFFEKLCILSAHDAISKAGINAAADNVIFVFSTTKGNVDTLAEDLDSQSAYIGGSAQRIARHFGNANTPIIASNACISGVCAQIAAVRSLLAGRYTTAVVVGADVLSRFIISGFQSFKALSPDLCMPYDKNRCGLNLGEAAGTIVLQNVENAADNHWHYVASAIHNDANHISGPSRTGEGSYRVLRDILTTVSVSDIAFVNAHGTATPYNDEMESIAIHRAELDEVPVNGLKGYYGHTLGAAGIIETILSMQAVDNGKVIATKGFDEVGTSYTLNISNEQRPTDKRLFIKLLSGFGGSNAGIAYAKGGSQ